MPPVQPPADQWLANQLAQMKTDIAALKTQQTTFVTNAAGAAQAIIGNLAFDSSGASTGLTGFGIAVKHDSAWVQVLPSLIGSWVAPALLNSWVNNATFATAGYLKDPLGFVHLKGRIQTGATGTVAFQLPAGFRPGAKDSYSGGGITGGDHADIDTAGNVTCFMGGTVFGLGGISFLAEN